MSIDFKSAKGIFQQIAENLSHRILEGTIIPGERMPSVRDLAEEFEVNRNTILRSYAILQDDAVIENSRGIGFFVSQNALEIIHNKEKEDFLKNELPDFTKKIQLLKLTEEELSELFTIIQNNKTT